MKLRKLINVKRCWTPIWRIVNAEDGKHIFTGHIYDIPLYLTCCKLVDVCPCFGDDAALTVYIKAGYFEGVDHENSKAGGERR